MWLQNKLDLQKNDIPNVTVEMLDRHNLLTQNDYQSTTNSCRAGPKTNPLFLLKLADCKHCSGLCHGLHMHQTEVTSNLKIESCQMKDLKEIS